MPVCMVMDCERETVCRGMCRRHYLAWNRKTPHRDRSPVVYSAPERHAELVGLFGGVRPFCRAVGIDPNTLYRWPDGAVPRERWGDIEAGAARSGADVEAVRAVLVK